MSIVAAVPTLLVLSLGACMLARSSGYIFDLRRKSRAPFAGGQRAADPV